MLALDGTMGTLAMKGGRLMKGGNCGIPKKCGPYGKGGRSFDGGVAMGERFDKPDGGVWLTLGLDERSLLASDMLGLTGDESRE